MSSINGVITRLKIVIFDSGYATIILLFIQKYGGGYLMLYKHKRLFYGYVLVMLSAVLLSVIAVMLVTSSLNTKVFDLLHSDSVSVSISGNESPNKTCTYGMESLVAQKEAGAPYHDLGSIMNSRLLMLYPEEVKSITVGDSFPSASPNEIVVVDDCLYQYANERRNTELKMELEKYVLAGGITLLSLQNISELTDLIKLHENVKPDHIEKMVGFVLDKSRANLTDLAKHEPFKSNPAILNLNSRRGNGSWLIASYPGTEQEIMSIGVSPYFDPEAIHNFLNEIC